MHRKSSKVLNAGLDWMTITQVDGDKSYLLYEQAHRIAAAHLPSNVETKEWSAMGYYGKTWGPLKIGTRNVHEAIMIVSGGLANEAVSVLELDPERATRVDLQVTVGLDKPAPLLAQELYKTLPNLPKSSRYSKLLTYYSSHQGDTLYVGKRGREQMLRIYDKSMDLGYEGPGFAWRYEMEYRRRAAKLVLTKVNAAENVEAYVLSQVLAELKKRGISSSFSAGQQIGAIEVGAKVTTPQTRLDWLARCVSPVVIKLVDAGFEKEVIDSLRLREVYRRKF